MHLIKKYTFIFIVLFLLVMTREVNAQTLTRVLKSGSRGADVKILQQWLNSDPDTQIAKSGTGSPGQEGNTFGPATVRAVQKFQLKYKLVTKGGAGYGMVGPKTRNKLNELFGGQAVVTSKAAIPAKPKTIIRGEITGIAPDKTEFNVKYGTKRFDYMVLIATSTIFLDKNNQPTSIEEFNFGDIVEVRGHLKQAYMLLAVSVKDVTPWKVAFKENSAVIKEIALSDGELIITTPKNKEYRVTTNPQTKFLPRTIEEFTPALADFSVGEVVGIQGVLNQRTGLIFAERIQKK